MLTSFSYYIHLARSHQLVNLIDLRAGFEFTMKTEADLEEI